MKFTSLCRNAAHKIRFNEQILNEQLPLFVFLCSEIIIKKRLMPFPSVKNLKKDEEMRIWEKYSDYGISLKSTFLRGLDQEDMMHVTDETSVSWTRKMFGVCIPVCLCVTR